MEELKSLFGEGSLSYEEFSQKLGEAGNTIKLANLKSGNYVDKAKYEKLERGFNDYQTKYDALTESTKGFDELKASYDNITEKYNALLAKQDETEKMGLINGANVDPDFTEFVYDKVQKLTNDDKDFKTALNEYLEEHKQYLKGASNKNTYVDLENGKGTPKSANEKMNDFIRGKRNGI